VDEPRASRAALGRRLLRHSRDDRRHQRRYHRGRQPLRDIHRGRQPHLPGAQLGQSRLVNNGDEGSSGGGALTARRAWCLTLLTASVLALSSGTAVAQGLSVLSWQAPVLSDPLPQERGPDVVSCPTVSLCVVADSAGQILTTTSPTAGAGDWSASPVDSQSNGPRSFLSVSCPSVSLCIAVDNTSAVAASSNPTAGASAWQTFPLPNSAGWATTVSCPAISLCVVGTEGGTIETSAKPAAGSGAWTSAYFDTATVPAFDRAIQAYVVSISCPSVSLCVGVDAAGNVFSSHNPTGGAGAWKIAHVGVAGPLSCPSVTLCVAGASGGLAISQSPTGNAGTWKSVRVDAAFRVEDVSCPSVSFCAAVDDGGRVLTSIDPTGGIGAWTVTSLGLGTPPRPDQLRISCASSSLCVAVDPAGHAVVGVAAPQSVIRGEIRTLLRGEITPAGRPPRITTLLRGGGARLSFAAPVTGGIMIKWLVSQPRRRSGKVERRSVPVASANRRFPTPGVTTLEVSLNKEGIALLKHATRLTLTARAVFAPDGSPPISATNTVELRR
jgi:hypothetical protein